MVIFILLNGGENWFAPSDRAVCNTLFVKQESQLVTYAAGPVKSTVDYIIVRQEDKARFVMSRSFQMKNVYQSTNC